MKQRKTILRLFYTNVYSIKNKQVLAETNADVLKVVSAEKADYFTCLDASTMFCSIDPELMFYDEEHLNSLSRFNVIYIHFLQLTPKNAVCDEVCKVEVVN